MNKDNKNSISVDNNQSLKNNLKDEISPYLLQHVNNPVNWYPWNDEAFSIAEKENKPIFLSIGYSTCHWCHVMEKESFEDEEVAGLMNKYFVNIKVDREERPDLDTIYMEVLQNMTGYGGWPMTILLTPNKKPFFAGTYFPKNDLGNRIGMKNLVQRIKEAWDESYFEIIESSNDIVNHIIETNTINNDGSKNPIELDLNFTTQNGYNSLLKSIDKNNGGFGFKPKFPNPQNLLFLLNYSINNNLVENLSLLDLTLSNMKNGGINDQIGGGFHRYSTDEKWILPHFEKMLYDNAQLISIYSRTGLICNNKDFLEVSIDIYNFLNREFLLSNNLFASSIDADSENKEGKFYVWEYNELLNEFNNFISDNNLLNNLKNNDIIINDYFFKLYTNYYNIDKDGNFEDESSRINEGTNIFYVTNESIEITKTKLNELGLTLEDFHDFFVIKFNDYLYDIRNKSVKPFLDKKAQVNWNCLLINGLVDLYVNLTQFKVQNIQKSYFKEINENEVLILAINIYNSIFENLFLDDSLFHYYLDGKVKSKAFLDDYAYLIESGINLYKNTLDKKYLNNSINLLEFVINNFYDEINGGFYNSQYNADLILNKKEIIDNTMPSGNSIMLQNLDYFYKITSNNKYKVIYNLSLRYFSNQISASPNYFCSLLNFFDESNSKQDNLLIIIVNNENEELKQKEVFKDYSLKNNIILMNPENIINDNNNTISIYHVIEGYQNYKLINDTTTFYYCSNFYCEKPTNNLSEIIAKLKN